MYNYDVIDSVLAKLDQIKFGEEIIYEEIENLKKDFNDAKRLMPVLGKRNWMKYIGGIILENAAVEMFTQHILPIIANAGKRFLLLN